MLPSLVANAHVTNRREATSFYIPRYVVKATCIPLCITRPPYQKNHAFARYVLPIASDAFGKQNWPGKKADEAKDDKPPAKGAKVQPQLSSEEQKMRDRLLEEMETRRNFENNVAKPNGDLKPLDSTALQQLESRLSIEDQ